MTQIHHSSPTLIPLAALFSRPQTPTVATPALRQPSNLEEEAAQRGFPATFHGYTPNSLAYWQEPGLPFMGTCPNTVEALEAFRISLEGTFHVAIPEDDDRMAPRFMGGAFLAVRPVVRKQDITPGVYLWEWHQDGETYTNIGRLSQVRRGRLELTQDRDGHPVWCRLRWSNPTFKLYKVIGYNSLPSI